MKPIVDSEFKNLIPPLTTEEYSQLEQNCVENGILDTIKVWNGIVIDGHNRLEIAKKHNLEYKTEELGFASRSDAIYWIIKNQLGRRNLSTYDRTALALRLEPVIAEKAKEQQIRKSVSQNSAKQKPIDTREEVAKNADVSHDTVLKVKAIENSGDDELIADARKGKKNGGKSINSAYQELKRRQKKENPVAVKVECIEQKPKTVPVHFEDVPATEPQKVKIRYVEEDDAEEVEDAVADTANDFAKSLMARLNRGMMEIINVNKYSRVNVTAEIRNVKEPDIPMEDFKKQIQECIRVLVHLENGLFGVVVKDV